MQECRYLFGIPLMPLEMVKQDQKLKMLFENQGYDFKKYKVKDKENSAEIRHEIKKLLSATSDKNFLHLVDKSSDEIDTIINEIKLDCAERHRLLIKHKDNKNSVLPSITKQISFIVQDEELKKALRDGLDNYALATVIKKITELKRKEVLTDERPLELERLEKLRNKILKLMATEDFHESPPMSMRRHSLPASEGFHENHATLSRQHSLPNQKRKKLTR